MSEKSREAAAKEAREKARNLPPQAVEAPVDLNELVRTYNAAEEEQKARLTALLMACLQPGGPSRVEFGTDAWSNIRAERLDIATNVFVDKFIHYITKVG